MLHLHEDCIWRCRLLSGGCTKARAFKEIKFNILNFDETFQVILFYGHYLRVDIPKAPGLGLMLDKLHYDTYNRKFGNDGVHQPLDWDDYKQEMETFKKEQVGASRSQFLNMRK
jgi:hypothetical protein